MCVYQTERLLNLLTAVLIKFQKNMLGMVQLTPSAFQIIIYSTYHVHQNHKPTVRLSKLKCYALNAFMYHQIVHSTQKWYLWSGIHSRPATNGIRFIESNYLAIHLSQVVFITRLKFSFSVFIQRAMTMKQKRERETTKTLTRNETKCQNAKEHVDCYIDCWGSLHGWCYLCLKIKIKRKRKKQLH